MVIDAGITDAIMSNISKQENLSQQQDPVRMATSSSNATITGIYSTSQLAAPASHSHSQKTSQQSLQPQQSKSKQPQNVHYSNIPSKHSKTDSKFDSRASSIKHCEVMTAGVVQNKQNLNSRPISNTAASTLNAGVTSQHSYSNSQNVTYSQSF